jgi:hypothetical protein
MKLVKVGNKEGMDMMEYNRWMAEHSEELSRKYTGEYLGIVNFQVVAVNEDERVVHKILREKYADKLGVISYMPKEKEIYLLI